MTILDLETEINDYKIEIKASTNEFSRQSLLVIYDSKTKLLNEQNIFI